MADITENEFTFLSANGTTAIHVHQWMPEGTVRGVVQIAHGIAEYIERYADFACCLAENGYVVVGNDHLGHGKSIMGDIDLGFFAYDDGWNIVVKDMEQLRIITSSKFPFLPYFMFGHSMGSFLARTHLILYPKAPLNGVVLSGTGQNPKATLMVGEKVCEAEMNNNGSRFRSEKVQNMFFGSYNRGFEPKRTDFDWLSREESNVDAYIDDPLCGFVATVGLYHDLMGGLRLIADRSNLALMNKNIPVYFISGDKDPVGACGKGVRKVYSMFAKAGMNDVSLRLYEGGRHEMLNETNRDEVFSDVLNWLESKNPNPIKEWEEPFE